MNNVAGKIYVSTNYDSFRKMTGNRDVSERHKNEIIRSIKKFGYISNPIAVNERMEVVDGQRRLAALKDLGLPVEYFIIRGATAIECAGLNGTSKNWNTKNFIKSMADQGDSNYKLLQCLIIAHPRLRSCDLYGLAATPVRFGVGTPQSIFDGSLRFTINHYEWADNIASMFDPFINVAKNINAEKRALLSAILFILTIPEINVDRLYKILSRRKSIMTNGTVKSSVEEIGSLYNNMLRVGRIDIAGAWESREHLRVLEDKWNAEIAAQRAIAQ